MCNQIKMYGRTFCAEIENPLMLAKAIYDGIKDHIVATDGAIPIIKAIRDTMQDEAKIMICVGQKKKRRTNGRRKSQIT